MEACIEDHPEWGAEVERLKRYAGRGMEMDRFRQLDRIDAWKRVDRKTGKHPGWYRRRMFARWSVAAAVLVACAMGGLWIGQPGEREETSGVSVAEVRPGTFRAELELPGGDRVFLQDARGREIVTKRGNVLANDTTHTLFVQERDSAVVEYGTIRVPAGGEYRVVLSDGTGVWINAGSELKFPTSFTGKDRVVELRGEAYFDVTRDAEHPFIVRTGQSAVRVLGTAFNVCSYDDDAFEQTTLVRGKVEVLYGDRVYPLHPGEQFEMQKKDARVEVKKVDTGLYVSWQEGVFRFRDMPLDEFAVKLQRWYDVNFFFANESCKKYRFTGAIRKDADFRDFIHLIESVTRVKFTLKENTVIITEK